MIVSMTGFGRGEVSENGISLTVEMKSVNSRYLDISMRLPQAVQEKELEIKELIQQQVSRGKFNVSVRMDRSDTGEPDITFNPKLVRGYRKLLNDLRKEADVEQPVSLEMLMQFSDIFTSREEDPETVETIRRLTLEGVKQALDQLAVMRRQEGSQLQNDLRGRADDIDRLLEEISRLTEGRAPEAREKLMERIRSLTGDESLNEERLEMEVAVLVDKMDITEEIVRLQAHLKFFREALEQEEAVGRRLNFLSQEMNREINTIGSKANSAEISRCVVQAKENLEQIREQVQNVE